MSLRQLCWWTRQRKPLPQRWVTTKTALRKHYKHSNHDLMLWFLQDTLKCSVFFFESHWRVSGKGLQSGLDLISRMKKTAAPAAHHLAPTGGPCLSCSWSSLRWLTGKHSQSADARTLRGTDISLSVLGLISCWWNVKIKLLQWDNRVESLLFFVRCSTMMEMQSHWNKKLFGNR